MSQRPRPLRPELSPAHLLGAHLRALREEQGLSQAQLGALVFCSGDLIRKVETAERRPRADLISRCDEALSTESQLMRLMTPARKLPAKTANSPGDLPLPLAVLPMIRRVLDANDCPADGPTRSLDELTADVRALVHRRLNSRYDELAVSIPALLPELHRAHLTRACDGTARLLIQAYRAADALADKYGVPDLSARLIDLMRRLADATSDPLDVAAVAYVRAEAFMISGDYDTGCGTLDRAIAAHPVGGREHRATCGALHMRCAILAARARDPKGASCHLDAAAILAAGVPDSIYRGTAFGPSSVRIHKLSAALEADDPATAIAVGAGWQPGPQVPAERRSHFHIDLSRAYLAVGRPDDSLHGLYEALAAAPQHARHHAAVHSMVHSLLAVTSSPGSDLINLGKKIGALTEVN